MNTSSLFRIGISLSVPLSQEHTHIFMSWKTKIALFSLTILVLSCLPMQGQTAYGKLSGVITSPSGAPIANAKISVVNAVTGQAGEVDADSSGAYQLENLAPGEYALSVAALGFASQTVKVTVTAGEVQKTDLTLGMAANPSGPSLSDLGFPSSETQPNPAEQARLDRRSHMLKIHQKMGLITAGPLLATIITGFSAGGHQTSSTSRDLHAALGSTTAGLYFTTAYFAIFAPRIPGTETRGPIRVHKALAWIHGPGMILTPILGAMAFDQKSKGEKVHGIASLHGPVAIITGAAYGAALLSVSVKF